MTSAGKSSDILCRRTNKIFIQIEMHTVSNSGVTPSRTFAAREACVLPSKKSGDNCATIMALHYVNKWN